MTFEEIKLVLSDTNATKKCSVVIATVKGDIHDIGKNIVKLLLENYGFKELGSLKKPVQRYDLYETSAKEIENVIRKYVR